MKKRTRLWISRVTMLRAGCVAFLEDGNLCWLLPTGISLRSMSDYDMELNLQDREGLATLQPWMQRHCIQFA